MTGFEELAESAGLEYVFDDMPGLRRVRRGNGFVYLDPAGEQVDDATRDWIRSLVIPPAWTDVWIAPSRKAHILATGRDKSVASNTCTTPTGRRRQVTSSSPG